MSTGDAWASPEREKAHASMTSALGSKGAPGSGRQRQQQQGGGGGFRS